MHQLFTRSLFLAAVLAFLPACVYAQPEQHADKPIIHGPRNEKVVALTFDDGPDPRYTHRVVSLLKDEGIHATFFEVGKFAEKYPYLTKLVVENGNVVGNHSYSHPDLRLDKIEHVRFEVLRGAETLEKITGKHPALFRPPKGLYDEQILEALKGMGYQTVLWSLTVEHKSAKTPMEMADRVINLVQPGTIILAHDGRLDREHTLEALPMIIETLKAEGYRFVTVPEMIELIKKAEKKSKSTGQASKPSPKKHVDKQNDGWLSHMGRHVHSWMP